MTPLTGGAGWQRQPAQSCEQSKADGQVLVASHESKVEPLALQKVAFWPKHIGPPEHPPLPAWPALPPTSVPAAPAVPAAPLEPAMPAAPLEPAIPPVATLPACPASPPLPPCPAAPPWPPPDEPAWPASPPAAVMHEAQSSGTQPFSCPIRTQLHLLAHGQGTAHTQCSREPTHMPLAHSGMTARHCSGESSDCRSDGQPLSIEPSWETAASCSPIVALWPEHASSPNSTLVHDQR